MVFFGPGLYARQDLHTATGGENLRYEPSSAYKILLSWLFAIQSTDKRLFDLNPHDGMLCCAHALGTCPMAYL